jgi:hypothetical protein
MTTVPAVPALPDDYLVDVVALKGASKRVDWNVTAPPAVTPADAPDFVAALRRFFADFAAEIEARKHDPIATGQALAKVEAIAADLRFIVARLRTVTAEAMNDYDVRRIIVAGVGVWEASSTVERRDWRHDKLITDYLRALGFIRVIDETGETKPIDDAAAEIGALYGPSTAPRTTPLKEAGLRPDDYCTIKLDEDEKPMRTPTVSMRVNDVRRDGVLS